MEVDLHSLYSLKWYTLLVTAINCSSRQLFLSLKTALDVFPVARCYSFDLISDIKLALFFSQGNGCVIAALGNKTGESQTLDAHLKFYLPTYASVFTITFGLVQRFVRPALGESLSVS